jgi:sugar lactone lactonase YvrE
MCLIATFALGLVGCGSTDGNGNGTDKPDEPEGYPALGAGSGELTSVQIDTIVDSEAGLDGPWDLAFNPENRDQLWVVNHGDSSTVVVTAPGTEEQSTEKFAGPGHTHFMSEVASLSFGDSGFFATAQQEDEKTQPTTPADFMGATLWTSDLSTFDAGHGGHYDMLHNSPNASGIAWEEGNAYWVFDGYHSSITRYDFNEHHGAGGSDHTDGIVRRYVEGEVGFEEGVVSHLAYHHESEMLYIADTANGRIAVLDTTTGEVGGRITPNYDGSDQKHVNGAETSTLIGSESGLQKPAGLELHDGLLFVGDNATSTIYAFDLDGEMVDSLDLSSEIAMGGMQGLTLDAEGRIYVTDGAEDRVVRLSATAENAQP